MPRIGSKERIRRFFCDNVGVVLDSKQLQEASGGAREFGRRIRELREEGWQIKTHNDRSDLKPGQYILEDNTVRSRQYIFASRISKRVRAQVLERNGYTCQMCGAAAGEDDEQNPGRAVRLHIGHIVDRSHGGTDEPANLRALCSACNQGAKNVVQEPPSWTWLLAQIRRASIADQQKALEWLRKKLEG